MHLIMRLAVGLLPVLLLAGQPHAYAADETITLRYSREQDLSYLVGRTLTRVKKHKNNETKTLRERAMVRYGKPEKLRSGKIRLTRELSRIGTEGSMKRAGIYRLHTLPTRRKKYPTGRLTKFATGDSVPGRPWTLLELSGMFAAFPIFPEQPVAPGDTWEVKMQMCSPSNYKAILPVTIQHRLRGLETRGEKTYAVIQYTFQGSLETAKHPEMLETKLLKQIAPKYSLSGDGTVTFDVQAGVVVKKEQHFEWTKAWTGKLDSKLVKRNPNWEVDVDQVTSSRITTRLISDDKASALIKEAEKARQSKQAGRKTKATPPPKWTYYVNRTAVRNNKLRKKKKIRVDRAFVGYGAGKPRIIYVDEQKRPLQPSKSAGVRFQPLPADKDHGNSHMLTDV